MKELQQMIKFQQQQFQQRPLSAAGSIGGSGPNGAFDFNAAAHSINMNLNNPMNNNGYPNTIPLSAPVTDATFFGNMLVQFQQTQNSSGKHTL